MSAALETLREAHASRSTLLSVGLEPGPKYLARGFEPTLDGYERFLRLIIEATTGIAAAYKFNVAFFEALGSEGWGLMERLRADLPRDALAIADGKFCDIGSSAERYAEAMYGRLGVDSATVNPMLGRDSVEPWLAWSDRLTFFLVLTSNPGARDVLLVDGLYRRLARSLTQWGSEGGASSAVGFVVGATRGDRIGEVREIAPEVAFLVPGVGAQGGSIEETVAIGRRPGGGYPGLLFHVTRGLLPDPEESGDPGEIIRRKAEGWRDSVNRGFAEASDE